VELGHSPAPPAAARGSRSGRCVSARTRERSRRPLPLQPAFACGEWLAGGGEWPGLGLGLAAAPAPATAAAAAPAAAAAASALKRLAAIGCCPRSCSCCCCCPCCCCCC
jgi:hypothetical protein